MTRYRPPHGDAGPIRRDVDNLLGRLRAARRPDADIGTLLSYRLLSLSLGRYVPTVGYELLTRNCDRFQALCTARRAGSRSDIVDRRVLDGNLFQQIDGIMGFVESNIRRWAGLPSC